MILDRWRFGKGWPVHVPTRALAGEGKGNGMLERGYPQRWPIPAEHADGGGEASDVADDDRGLVGAGGGDRCEGSGHARSDGVAGFAIGASGAEIPADDPGLQDLGAASNLGQRGQHRDVQAEPLSDPVSSPGTTPSR